MSPPSQPLAKAALAQYRFFVGPLWERFGEAAWLRPWREVYARAPATAANLVTELRAIADPTAQLAIPWLLEPGEQAAAAGSALAGAFDDPAVTELRVFTMGDGGAMSGLLIAGHRAPGGDRRGDLPGVADGLGGRGSRNPARVRAVGDALGIGSWATRPTDLSRSFHASSRSTGSAFSRTPSAPHTR